MSSRGPGARVRLGAPLRQVVGMGMGGIAVVIIADGRKTYRFQKEGGKYTTDSEDEDA